MPNAAGAPKPRFVQPIETITSTTTVATYGSAWKSSGATVTPRACSVNGSAEKAPKKYAPTRHSYGRQKAKITSAIAIQPAPCVSPSTHCGVIMRLKQAPPTPAKAPPTMVCA